MDLYSSDPATSSISNLTVTSVETFWIPALIIYAIWAICLAAQNKGQFLSTVTERLILPSVAFYFFILLIKSQV